jgi:hypothetical protein
VTRAGEPRLDARELLGQEGDVLLLGVRAEAEAILEARLGGGQPVSGVDPQAGSRGLHRAARRSAP